MAALPQRRRPGGTRRAILGDDEDIAATAGVTA